MGKTNMWLDEIILAMELLGGKGSLTEIYNVIENNRNINFASYTDWKSRVRNQIYLHSSDTEIFKGKPWSGKDLFYSVKEKGEGYWGLR